MAGKGQTDTSCEELGMESFLQWVLGRCKDGGQGGERERQRERVRERKGIGRWQEKEAETASSERERDRGSRRSACLGKIGSGQNLSLKGAGYPGDWPGQQIYFCNTMKNTNKDSILLSRVLLCNLGQPPIFAAQTGFRQSSCFSLQNAGIAGVCLPTWSHF